MDTILGLDIGGANTKVCWLQSEQGRVIQAEGSSFYYEVWQDTEGLRTVLQKVCSLWTHSLGGRPRGIALTMTAELCDIFKSRAEGVLTILRQVEETFPGFSVHIWTTEGVFANPASIRRNPMQAAAANWLASAAALARSSIVQGDPAVLMDMGSTTTDILPVGKGEVLVEGRTDLERLRNGELVYTGVLRTQTQAIVDRVFAKGRGCPVASEYFSITGDVYRLLGTISEEEYDVATPDGCARDKDACAKRLARLVTSDPDELGWEGVLALALHIKEKQIGQVMDAVIQILSRLPRPWPNRLISASQGEFIVREVARRLGWDVISWWKVLPQARAELAMTAYSVAWLLTQELSLEE